MIYTRRPSAEELGGLGLLPEDVADQFSVGVWPENWPAVALFVELTTQWRFGPAGPTGLDYGVLPILCPEWRDHFDDLRVMEAAALEEMRKK